MLINFYKNLAVCGIIWKSIIEVDTPHLIIWYEYGLLMPDN